MALKTRKFKDIQKELEEICRHLPKAPIMIVDTGSLIDLQRESERANKKIEEYLAFIDSKTSPLVTPEVAEEVNLHGTARINGHRREISPYVLGTTAIYHENFRVAYSNLDSRHGNSLLKNWLMARHIGEEISLESDCPSETDLGIIQRAADFVSVPNFNGEFPSRVLVLTSDRHVVTGTKMLNSFGYLAKAINTRESRK